MPHKRLYNEPNYDFATPGKVNSFREPATPKLLVPTYFIFCLPESVLFIFFITCRMHPYLTHLLADIAAAHCTTTFERKPDVTIEKHFEEVEAWIAGNEPEHTFGYYCGLQAVNFPPATQLTEKEMKLVCRAFEHMMFTWNHGIDLPKILPIAIAYKMTVDTLDSKTTIVNSGMLSFDFCTGYAPDCVFKQYCPCLRYWKSLPENDLPNARGKDGLPF